MASRRQQLIAALLAGTLLLTAALAFQAFRATALRREVAQAALRDHATFAVAEYVRRAREAINQNVIVGLMRPALNVNASLPVAQLPPASILDRTPGRPPAVDVRDSVRAWFRLVLAGRSLTTARDSLSPAAIAWLRDSIPAHARGRLAQNAYAGVLGGAPDGEAVVAAYMMRYDAAGELSVVYGAVLPVRALQPVLEAPYRGPPLLPRVGAPVPNDTALIVEVSAASGAVAFSTGVLDPLFVASDTLGAGFGGLVARIAPRIEAAERLVIGGLASIPVIPLLGAFILVAGLLGVTLLQMRREAELVQLREDFVAGVSHELRTPLAQIRLFAETLLLDRLRSPDERDRALRIVHDESRRLSQLVDNLLQFSRTGRPPDTTVTVDVDLAPLVREVIEQTEPLAAQRGVRFHADGPPVAVRGDRDALRQVLLNLLDNAVRYGPDGQGITVRTDKADTRVRLVVDDQGPGISPADRARVFERFSRLHAGSARTGAGLGLAVVKELVELQKGMVWIESNDDGGCRVTVELPAGHGA